MRALHPSARTRRGARTDREGGAVAVEFALVVPVLLLLLFGIIDYGLWFSDTLSARSGVRDAARAAVVGDIGPGCTLEDADHAVQGTPSAEVRSIMCSVHDRVGGVSGHVYVGVQLPNKNADGSGPTGWFVDRPLAVCAVVVEQGVTGFVPLPNGHRIESKTVMTIEQPMPSGASQESGFQQPTKGSQLDWSWCAA